MLRNYFIIALRNLMKQKTFTFINVFGLAVGVACWRDSGAVRLALERVGAGN